MKPLKFFTNDNTDTVLSLSYVFRKFQRYLTRRFQLAPTPLDDVDKLEAEI